MSSTGQERREPLSATESTSSRIADEEGIEPAKQQEPFPPSGTFPDQRSPVPVHPGVERLLNFAARHVVPDRPGPSSGDEDDDGPEPGPTGSQAETAARPTDKQDQKDDNQRMDDAQRRHDHEAAARERAQREEEPIIAGTPLDEMTPFVEMGGEQTATGMAGYPFTSKPSQAARQASARSVRPISAVHEEDADDESHTNRARTAQPSPRNQRPGYGQGHEMGSVRMGASALFSALNSIPWDESDSDSSDDDEQAHARNRRMAQSTANPSVSRPKMNRLGSSLNTIRPMGADDVPPSAEDYPSLPDGLKHPNHPLHFPFRANAIARHARSPGISEMQYQLGHRDPESQQQVPTYFEPAKAPRTVALQQRSPSNTSEETDLSVDAEQKLLLNERTVKEEAMAEAEEEEEMLRAASDREAEAAQIQAKSPLLHGELPEVNDGNTNAALREPAGPKEQAIEEGVPDHRGERQRVRREKLAERLMQVFGLEEREEVLEEYRCWLLRSVMLKGYMYLTPKHICFFAHMPDRENLIVKTGPLQKKSSRTKLNSKYWFVLKNDVLSWYESTADPYFPKGNVSLQYVSSCDAIDDTRFKLRLPERNYTLTAESESSRDEWVRAIQKVMFKTQHEGESVKLIIPLEAIVEVDQSPTLEFAETVEVKCVDPDDQMSVDSYFFASFSDNERAYKTIQALVDSRPTHALPQMPVVSSPSSIDTRSIDEKSFTRPRKGSDTASTLVAPLKKLGHALKPLLPSHGHKSNDHASDDDDHHGGMTEAEKEKEKGLSFLRTRTQRSTPLQSQGTLVLDGNGDGADGGYPPRQTGPPPVGMTHDDKSWTHAPSWLSKPAGKIFGSSPSKGSLLSKSSTRDAWTAEAQAAPPPTTRSGRTRGESVTEVVEPTVPETEACDSDDSNASHEEDYGHASSRSRRRAARAPKEGPRMEIGSAAGLESSRSEYDMMERSESGVRDDDETARKFRSVFSLSEKEELIDHFPGYLYRVLPVSGRFFVSTNYFCFRSSQLLYKTKMMIPIRDLYGMKAQKAFRFGHSGLIVSVKGHEELFLEFSSSRRRKACIAILEEQMEQVRLGNERGVPQELDAAAIRAHIMEDLDENTPLERRDHGGESASPSYLFGSTTSTFLEFKPEPMRVTCLTIGSRGDVQPYIALCKGLQAEGHTVRIASHGEYKDWVEGHGIEFASVGGDPAELMQMCVDNGMFTVSFLKEGIQKFRGWLDDLLMSSWKACQGSDLLIESPSAMAGVHIAEALRIPYYRAFTMPWTRTRAYPHAFAVPEHKRGGSYNYMTYTMFDQVFWRAISGQINRFRKRTLGIDSTTYDKLEQHKVPFLYNFSPNVVPPPLDWTEWIHVTGYWFLENADEHAAKKKWSPPEGLVEFIDKAHANGAKVVYIGFGSIVVSDPQEMTKCVVDAVVESGVYAILSKGWSDRGSKAKGDGKGDEDGADGIKYPDQIFAIDSIDHSWLFTKIDAACHHGGAGTTGASLRAGIPTIIKPFFGDQAFWSERVESLNVGSAVRKLTAANLAEALKKATTDEKQIAKARVVGEMIRKENGVQRAIEAIYRDLDYAKSLIKAPPAASPESKPLDKVTSLFAPLTHDLSLSRSRSGHKDKDAHDTEHDTADEARGPGSDESWDVVSNDGNGGSASAGGDRLLQSASSASTTARASPVPAAA